MGQTAPAPLDTSADSSKRGLGLELLVIGGSPGPRSWEGRRVWKMSD